MDSARRRLIDEAGMYVDSRPAEAVRILALALTTTPDDLELLELMVQAQLGSISGIAGGRTGLPFALRIIELKPSYAYGWRQLAQCYHRMRLFRQARDAARAGREFEPDFWASHTTVIHCDVSSELVTADTLASLAEAFRLAPNIAAVHYEAGRVAQALRHDSEAKVHYERALSLNPNHVDARLNHAMVQLRRQRLGSAAGEFVGLLGRNLKSREATRLLSVFWFFLIRAGLLLLAVCEVPILAFAVTDSRGTGFEIARLTATAVAVASYAALVLSIRIGAGSFFGRLVRSFPWKDAFLRGWPLVLTLCLAILVTSAFLPEGPAVALYLIDETLLVVSLCAMVTMSIRDERNRVRKARAS